MPRYIDADSLKSSVKAFNGGKQDLFVSMIECTSTADVAEVKHGEWITITRHEHYPSGKAYEQSKCSLCGQLTNEDYNYCPHCGAKMGGKE